MDSARFSTWVIVALLGVILGVGLGLTFGAHQTVVDTGPIAQALSGLSTTAAASGSPQYLLSSDGKTIWVISRPASATVWRLEGDTIKQVTDHPYQLWK